MSQISLTINGRPYEVTCDDGQEQHLQSLGDYLDRKVQELGTAVGQVGEPRLLVMAGLLVADELFEALQQLDQMDEAQSQQGAGQQPGNDHAAEAAASTALEAVARRVEDIAARLERA